MMLKMKQTSSNGSLNTRLIRTLKILPSKRLVQPFTASVHWNNTVLRMDCIVYDGRCWLSCQDVKISSESPFTNLPEQEKLPPLKDKPKGSVVEPSTTIPQQHCIIIEQKECSIWRMDLALSQDVEKMKCNPARGLSRSRGNPKEESLMLSSTTTQLNSRSVQFV